MTATRSTGEFTGHDHQRTNRPSPRPRPDSPPVDATPGGAAFVDTALGDTALGDTAVDHEPQGPRGMGRRSVLGWALAAPTLVVGAPLLGGLANPQAAAAAVPAVPELADLYDLGDLQDDAALATSHLITVVINTDGSASFALPRAEVGQGITTSTAMIIAEELDLPLSKVQVTLADARPELLFNQLTGGSNTTRSTYDAIRSAAALARGRLMDAAATKWGVNASTLGTKNGSVVGPGGRSAGYGELTALAAASSLSRLQVTPKDPKDFTVLGTPQGRVDALDAITGRKQYTADLQVPDAMPTMVCRPPTIKGTPQALLNESTIKAMPGITDVALVSTGVAVRGRTFGQCIDAIRAMKVQWNGGTEDAKSDADVLAELRRAEIPLVVPKVPLLAKTVEGNFTFYFRSNSPLETGTAIATYDAEDGIEVWSCMKVPIVLQEQVAAKYGFPLSKVKAHVAEGGGSFGRHLFSDAALEAVEIAKTMGKPVKLMWARTDDFRQGRTHPMATARVRATALLGNVLTYEHRHTSVSTDFTHGLGEILTAFASKLPAGNFTFAQSIWELTQTVSYNYGVTTQLLNEVDMGFYTGSMRNIYSPDQRTAQELITDQLAKLAGQDPYQYRRAMVKDKRGQAVLDAVAKAGNWGRTMPANTAQGIAVHNEYKGWCAALVEVDNTPATVNRQIRDAYTGPRVTRVTFAVDVGMTLNPKGLEAQMQSGIMDGIAQTFTSSLHLNKGTFAEGSWDQYYYTRQWNAPPSVQIIIMPNTSQSPGGAGEFGVAASMAAAACAYGRATGVMPTEFPINHNKPLPDDIFPTVPPLPPSPTDGLDFAY